MREFDWKKYEQLRDSGESEHNVCRVAAADGHSGIYCIKMLMDLFGVSIESGKEIYLQKDGSKVSLDEHQASWVPALEEFFRVVDGERDPPDMDS
jgi:hypothetical protein